ncbi:MAG TPA: ABC transporter permease [Myxococcales bacterium]|nr:ABC transporter permease [Myxococcales bacterium]
MGALLQDLRFAIRMLRKSPATTALSLLTLAVAIGASTSIFSLVSAMLLRPLPFPAASRLVELQDAEPGAGGEHGFSWPEFEELRAGAPDLAGIAAYRGGWVNLTGRGEPLRVGIARVTRGFFDVLGTPPVAGRSFAPEEHVENGPAVVMASPAFWRASLGEAPPGSTLLLDGVPYSLIGVAAAAPGMLEPADLWVPLERKLPWRDRGSHYLDVVARLNSGVSLERAKADLADAMPRIAAAAKATHLASMQSLQRFLHGSAAPLLLLLLGAVALVLLIAAANLASLVLSRAAGRVREFAVRRALGASGLRLARQLLVENGLVGLAGGALGLVLAVWGRDAMLRVWPASMPPLGDAPLDLRVLAFAVLVSLGAGVGIGLVPAVHAARGDLNPGLKEGAGATARGKARSLLVVAQSALAVLLLIGAALVLRSFAQLLQTNPGFQPAHAIALRVRLPERRYPGPRQRAEFFREVLERISALPGIQAAGAANRVPLGGGRTDGDFSVVGRPPLDEKDLPYADKRVITPGYFEAMKIPLHAGRVFSDADREPVVMINQTLARKIFPGEDPLGKQLRAGMFADGASSDATIVGIAADVKQQRLNLDASSEIYFPQAQVGAPEMEIVVRASGDPAARIRDIKAQIQAVDPDQPVASVRSLDQVIERAAAPQRLAAGLLGAFAGAALLLAALGIYGVVSCGVSQREREIGVRMALGAKAGDVLRMVLNDGLRLSLAGAVVGALLSLGIARVLGNFLYGVSATDPVTYALVGAGLALVAALASWLPARRATRVDPMTALRAE